MIKVNLYEDSEGLSPARVVRLGPTILQDGEAGVGAPQKLYCKNEGDTPLIAATVNLVGDHPDNVQLAQDVNGDHGSWSQAGQGIVALAEEVRPGELFPFWARATFTAENAPERLNFGFEIEAIGRNA